MISNIPQTTGIKYAGSKLKLLPYIVNEISKLNDVRTVCDAFAGTTRVGQCLSQLGYIVHSNDIETFSTIFGNCFLLNRLKDEQWYYDKIAEMNNLPPVCGWFTNTYGGENCKQPFQRKNLMKLDAIEEWLDIQNIPYHDWTILVTALILGLDKVDNTIGHFASYLRNYSDRSYNDLVLEVPPSYANSHKNMVTQMDATVCVQLPHDLVYLDPPYGSNNEKMPSSRIRYNAYYHFWNTVILNDQPKVFGKCGRREDSRDIYSHSKFEEWRKNEDGKLICTEAIDELIKKCECKYILMSYSNNGRTPKEDLMDIINTHGKLLNILEIDYKKNVMANMTSTNDWVSNKENKEYLITIQK